MAESWMTGTAIGQGEDIYYDPATKKYYGYLRGRYRDGRGRWRRSVDRDFDDMIELDESELGAFRKQYEGKGNLGRYRGRSGMLEYKGPGKARFEDREDKGKQSDADYRKKLMELSDRWDRELVGGQRGSARMSSIDRRKQVMSQMRDRYKRGGGWGSV